MITRLSKIARLPAHIREELNHRLHDGEISRTLIPWINELPETKKVTTDLYRGKPITHQNLSEWRHTGYQDWLSHQQRLAWNGRLAEEEAEVTEQNRCEDGFEAMGFQFLYDISQARKAMQQIKNPNQRWDRLETLTREFCRLQNAFNWSRRVGLEFDKLKLAHPCDNSAEPEEPGAVVALPVTGGASVLASRADIETTAKELIEVVTESEPATPKRQEAGALQDAPRNPEVVEPRASVLECGSPLPLSAENSNQPLAIPDACSAGIPACGSSGLSSPESNSQTPKLLNSQTSASTPKLLNSSTPTPIAPLPPLAPPTPTRNIPGRTSSPPIRGRRFICIEG